MSAARGRPVDMGKHLEIIDAALKILESEDTLTIERVAREAGVSRNTVYNHFGDLAELEIAVLLKKNVEIMRVFDVSINKNQTSRQALIGAGCIIANALTDDAFVNLAYILIAKKPKKKRGREIRSIVDTFYSKYKSILQEKVKDILELGVQRGELRINSSNINEVAEQLLAMWQGFQVIGLLIGAIPRPSQDVQYQRVVNSVDLILNVYRTDVCVD
ncbi:TetR/AcrR family transcriptional regulator [Allochromatium humboldtianum]|uniref:TetR/AcrR family transcriptional regulator n=1 Tax=Allochromatium humboldtianum TaxID=504901 RepID=A0A850RQB8_9GAMM|nr:TetR/AcrR family transcriptional regulator [Allochromatium humboldtianum]NVZ11711.1 TetR/AcrR family transcriptional regulator [Allochromatium humboldtianum]